MKHYHPEILLPVIHANTQEEADAIAHEHIIQLLSDVLSLQDLDIYVERAWFKDGECTSMCPHYEEYHARALPPLENNT